MAIIARSDKCRAQYDSFSALRSKNPPPLIRLNKPPTEHITTMAMRNIAVTRALMHKYTALFILLSGPWKCDGGDQTSGTYHVVKLVHVTTAKMAVGEH